ncbi:MAG: Ig-like domain-containing protein [Geminicoccaceae bacterium]
MATPQPDLVETARDVSVTLWPLANDAPTGLLVVAFQQPSFGTVTFDAEAQSFTYTPAPGFVGEDSFDYTVQGPDGATATATVTVRVVQPNRPPVAVEDVAAVAPGGTVEIDPLANDSDPDADPLTLVALGRPDSGSVTVLDGRRLRYAPRTGFVGEDSFTYTVSDGRGGTASATVRIGVAADNRAPTAPTLRTSTFAGQPVVVDLLAAASDPDGDPLVVTALGLPEHGTVAILEAGRVTYTPANGFEGTDRFTYTVGDGRGGTATGEVEIVVSLPNSAPRAVDDSATTETGNPVTIDVLANDSDAEGGPLALSRLSLPEHGRVRVESDQRLTYVPDAGFVGTDSFTYTVRDPRGAEASATVTVDVTAPAAPTTFLNGYRYRRRIVVPRGSVLGTAPLVGFPLLVAEEGPWLKSTAHGGRVESAQGFDLRFELETGGKLPHDVERYDPVAGRLVAWVRLTELRPNEDLVLFLYYGKPGLGASEADPAATWRDYLAVWHLPDPTDRTGRGRDLVATAVSTTEGPIGAAGRFDGTASEFVLADPSFLDGHPSLTVQLWVDSDRLDSDRGLLVCGPITGRDFDSAFVLRHASRGLYSSQARVFTAEMALADGRLVYESSPGRADDAAHALALVFDRGEGATLVVDGVADTPSYTVGSTLLGPTRIGRGPLRIGTGPLQSSAGRWLGLIDEVRLRATALPAAWLAMEHANQRAPATFYGIGGEDAFGDPNEAPVAAPLAARTTVGSAILLDPLAFASSPGGGTPVLAAVGTPTRGTATIEAGKIRYTPASGFVGTDRFTYTITKDGKNSTGTVSIRVEARASETSPAQDRPFADRFYGNPFHADGLAERRLQPGSPVAKRFLADRTGSLVAIGWPWRVDSGDGGDVVVKIETDHEGKPSGLAIGTTAINGDRGKPATQGASPEWSFEQPVPLEAGRAYHVVWYQVGTSGTVSILHHRAEVPIPTGRNLRGGPYEGDSGTIHQQSGGIWRPGSEHGGFLRLVWSDGLVTGNPIVAGAPGLKKSFGGPLMVRERFTVTDYTRKVDGVWLRVWWESGTPADLLVRLETLEGILLEQLVVPRTALPQTRNVAGDATSAPALWVHRRFTQAHTLERGRSYVLRLSTSTGSYVVHAVRRGDAPSREQWFDAWAELSTNGGGAWRGWDDSGDASGVPRTDCHLPIAFSIAGSVERVGVDSLIGTANWSFGDVRRLAEDAGVGDGLGEARAVVNGGTAWAHLGFPTPSRPPVGRQTFRIRARCSVSGGAIRVELFENGVFRRDLGTQPLGTSFSTLNFTWDAGLLADPTGAGVELRLGLVDNISSGYYVVDAVDWLADPAGSTTGSGGGGGGGAGAELPTPLRTINVANASQLSSALANAQPGDHIVLADGTYDLGGRMQLTRSGTAQAPIVVRAQNVLGARLPGGFEYRASTSHVWLWGLDFKDATTSFLRGANNILRRCRIWPRPNFSADVTGINVESGRNCRIDYCTIRLYTLSEIASLWPGQDWTEGRLYAAVRGHTSNAAGNRFENLVVERCHFVGGINRQNAYSRPYTSLFSNHGGFAEDVQQNLRHAWILRLSRFDSESATNIANHNNSGNVFDRVHIVGNGSGISKFRYSGWCTMSRCRLENAAFDIMGGYHVCENSIATRWNVFAGTCAWNDVSDGNKYPAAKNVRLSRCSGPVTVGANWGSAHTFPADATRIEAHRFGTITLVSGRETNTVQTAETSTPDLAPITLTASNVGVDAPWVGVEV